MTATQTLPPAGKAVPRAARVLSVVWALLPLLLGIPAAPCFAFAAYRCRRRSLAVEAGVYAAATVAFFALSGQSSLGTAAGVLGLVLMAVATVRAFVIRRAVFRLDGGQPEPSAAALAPAAPVAWHPPDPELGRPADPNQPATWHTPFQCTGYDRHRVSMPLSRTGALALCGAALTGFDVWAHISGRGLGTGIGLMLGPVLVALFARRVDGPTLYYRNFGVQHAVRLDQVTAVSAKLLPHQGIALRLTVPGAKRPVSVGIRAAGWVAPKAVRDHLRGWLDHPGDELSSDAAEVLRSGTFGGVGVHLPKQHRRLWAAAWLLIPLVAAGAVGWSVYQSHRVHAELAIKGAPGYLTMTGPRGKPMAVGRPWGNACEPLRIEAESAMPDAVYSQLTRVVDEARAIGLNLTLESRQFTWYPANLRIPPGMATSAVPVVVIGTTAASAPDLSSGRPERISEGWDARLDADGRHEDLTYVQGKVYLSTVGDDPRALRTALRELVAFAEGVGRSHHEASGIRAGATIDAFSDADAEAMLLMSGCG